MIKLSGSRFTDIMPENLAEQPEIQALAYAVGRQVEKLLAYADGARTYAAIYAVPEKVLDLLAVELRTPSYDENFSIKVKRTLIAESLLFYAQMGTPAAVNRIIETIFQAGHISEWWEYGGKPYHFKAYTTNPAITSDDVEEFKRVLGTVKRLSAWLDEIVLDLSTPPAEVFVGHWIHTGDFITLQRATMQQEVISYVSGPETDRRRKEPVLQEHGRRGDHIHNHSAGQRHNQRPDLHYDGPCQRRGDY